MTSKELAEFDGRDGRKAYVAVNGKIYDVSASPLWEKGDHQGAHQAGTDLTEELKTAPHVRSVIERFPVVAQLTDPVANTAPSKGVLIAVGAAVVAVAVALFVLL
jgi:predicted heme/steroid binding protein